MYLVINDDHDAFKTMVIDYDDLKKLGDGLIIIIDITDPENPLDYYDDGWHTIELV